MARPRDPLPRLNLNGPMNLHQQGPMPFSPALPTAIQQGFPPSFPMNNPLQTPMQPFFTQPPIPHHGRPGHLPGQHSIAGIPGAGMRPPNGFPPMTPVGGHGHFSRPSLMGIPGAPGMPGHPFPNRNRRQPSIGGPPKAVLGGPTRKVTPLPPVLNPPPPPAPKTKKVNINLPKETIPGEEGEEPRREPWARNILDGFEFKDQDIPPVNLSTAEPYPSDQERYHLPTLVDVFLPGKQAWQELKQQAIEEKLEKLGVEKGSGSNMPHIHAPHARAASISSPADPQILLYKLNKLHASQENSPVTSLAGSPNLAMGAPVPRFLQNRHGHAMSLALPMLNPSAPAFDPFGQHQQEVVLSPGAGLQDSIHASGIRSGGLSPGLVAPLHSSRPTSRPDFTRGFGLDIPDEAEEEELEAEETEEKEEQIIHAPVSEPAEDAERHDTFSPRFHERKASQESRAVDDIGVDYDRTHSERDRMSISQSRVHSRHVSRLSAALSTRSAGALDDEEFIGEEDVLDSVNYNNPVEAEEEEEVAAEERESDPVAEWTGTEDVYESSDDDESIGEWSNPSDEERARQLRIERRARRRASQQIDLPRRLPLFPRPPDIIGLSSYQEDDIISNPSDEEREVPARPFTFGQQHAHLIRPASSHDDGLGDSLSPVQHNRGPSDQHSVYDPAHAHSRESSQFVYPTNNDVSHQPQSSISSTRRDPALNPFAKPFVFGASRPSWAPPETPQADTPTPPQSAGHVRAPSTGKSLNAAAPEFKPGGFSFNFKPPGVPSMPQIPLELRAPSPEVEHSSPLRVQGREKRQKLGSDDFTEEGDSMASFRFPPAPAYTQKDESAPEIVRRSHAPADSIKGHRLNPSAEPFKFPGFAAAVKAAPAKDTDSDMVDDLVQSPAGSEPMELDEDEDADKENRVIASPEGVEQALHDESTLKGSSNVDDDPFAMPLVRPKRAPIPLDFKHPVSTNTVPAGLFKALVNNGDGPARRSTIHSRMTSREIFEHNREPSMDDANVPSISNVTSRSRSRLVTDPGNRRASPHDDVFGGNTGHARRRSSFTDAIRPIRPLSRSDAQTNSASSAASLTGRFELQLTEKRIETLFEDRFSALSKSLYQDASERHAITQSVLAEIQSMFRSQLRDSVARSLEDSQLDARADLDIQLFKDIVENANQELIKYFGEEVQALQQQVWESRTNADHSMDASSALEEMANRTISAIVEAVSELSARQEAINHNVPAREHDALVDKLMTVLTPVLASIRTEPVDYEFLTSQLTQAVKPHISQLIDLASDKRETAGLIVERILPLLPSTNFDIDAVTRQLTAEVRRAIAPIDAFEIKEQVADLVVERLDSRLSVRDKAFNVDTIVTKVSENMSQALATLNALPSNLEAVSSKLGSASEHQAKAAESQEQTLQLLDSLPAKLTVELASLKDIQSTQADILAELHRQATTDVKAEVPDLVTPALETLTAAQKDLTSQASSIKVQNDTVLEQLSTLPASFETAIGALQTSQAELFATLTTSQGEMDELKKSNSDLQIQLNKARGAHGQIRVEKDTLQNKLASVEGERERLKIQLEGARASGNERVAQVSSLEAKNKELEAALAQALEKLQVSDVAAQASQQRISELESANLQLNSENQGLKSKVEAVQLEVSFINKAKESVAERLAAQQEQYAQLQLQQSQWDELRRTSEKLDLLSTMVSQLDNEELQELRRYRDRTKTLEGEHSALQRRFKDQEAKLSNNERAAFTARQSLSQAQSRASEWEKRTKEYEGKVELLQTKLEHAEQTHAQLEADHSLVKLQLEEREANDRLVVDQQTKMQNTIAGLEAKIGFLQSELETARSIKVAPTTNGHAPPRPDSRASTIFDRSSTPVGRTNTPPQPQASVWDSMHAPSPLSNGTKPVKAAQPKIQAPRSKYPYPSNLTQAAMKQHHSFHQPPQHLRRSTASPAPSAISAAPTQGDDGWWE